MNKNEMLSKLQQARELLREVSADYDADKWDEDAETIMWNVLNDFDEIISRIEKIYS